MKRFWGYVLVCLVVAILAAAAVLLLSNIRRGPWELQLFFGPVTAGPATVMVYSALGGLVILFAVWKLLPAAIRILRSGAEVEAPDEAAQPGGDRRKS